jgi:hypothetical protein
MRRRLQAEDLSGIVACHSDERSKEESQLIIQVYYQFSQDLFTLIHPSFRESTGLAGSRE